MFRLQEHLGKPKIVMEWEDKKMYNHKLTNKELVQHHTLVKYNTGLTLEEILDDNPLFIVEEQDESIYKIIPLFNCDNIISTNPNDQVFEGRCIIAIENEDTIINFISERVISDLDINYSIAEKYGETLIIGIVLDGVSKVGLSNIQLTVEILDENYMLKKSYKLKTDVFGGYVANLRGYSNNDIIRIKAEYEGISKTLEIEV